MVLGDVGSSGYRWGLRRLKPPTIRVEKGNAKVKPVNDGGSFTIDPLCGYEIAEPARNAKRRSAFGRGITAH